MIRSFFIYISAELKRTKFYKNSYEIERMTQRKAISLRNVYIVLRNRKEGSQFPVTYETHLTICIL